MTGSKDIEALRQTLEAGFRPNEYITPTAIARILIEGGYAKRSDTVEECARVASAHGVIHPIGGAIAAAIRALGAT